MALVLKKILCRESVQASSARQHNIADKAVKPKWMSGRAHAAMMRTGRTQQLNCIHKLRLICTGNE